MGKFSIDYSDYFTQTDNDKFLSFYDQVDLLDFTFHSSTKMFSYPCPCGDVFLVSLEDLRNGENVSHCPSCSLVVLVIFSSRDLDKYA